MNSICVANVDRGAAGELQHAHKQNPGLRDEPYMKATALCGVFEDPGPYLPTICGFFFFLGGGLLVSGKGLTPPKFLEAF